MRVKLSLTFWVELVAFWVAVVGPRKLTVPLLEKLEVDALVSVPVAVKLSNWLLLKLSLAEAL